MYFFKQSAYLLLDAPPPGDSIVLLLREQGFPVHVHERGIDLLTNAAASVVYEVTLDREHRISIFLDVLNHTWPDTLPDEHGDPVTYLSWHTAAFGAFVAPGCLERAVQECRVWPNAKHVVQRHNALLRIRYAYTREAGEPQTSEKRSEVASPFEELLRTTEVVLALDSLPGVLAYFFPGGEALRDRELLHSTWNTYLHHDRNPFALCLLWINTRRGYRTSVPDWIVLDTIGLDQLDMEDIEVYFQPKRYQPAQVIGWLFNVASYLYEHGPIIEDGQTVNGPANINWQTYHFASSVQFPSRPVLGLRPQDGSQVPPALLKRLPLRPQ